MEQDFPVRDLPLCTALLQHGRRPAFTESCYPPDPVPPIPGSLLCARHMLGCSVREHGTCHQKSEDAGTSQWAPRGSAQQLHRPSPLSWTCVAVRTQCWQEATMLFTGRWWGCVGAAARLGFSSLASPLTQSTLPTQVGAAPVLGFSVLPWRPPFSCFWTCLLSLHEALCEAFSPTGSRAEWP